MSDPNEPDEPSQRSNRSAASNPRKPQPTKERGRAESAATPSPVEAAEPHASAGTGTADIGTADTGTADKGAAYMGTADKGTADMATIEHPASAPAGGSASPVTPAADETSYRSLAITVDNLRANSRAVVSIRDDQAAAWSEGTGSGLAGLRISSGKDPALFLRNFLINTQQMYLQSYADCQEILVQLYVRTAQRELRGRISLPPGASVTLQSEKDRTSLIGHSSFAIEL